MRADGLHGQSALVIDEDRAPLVRQAFELYATGEWPLHALQLELQQRGLRTASDRPLSRAMLALTLRNPAYVGRMRWRGVEYAGNHTPIVSPELFDRVQSMLDTKALSGERQRRHMHPLKGILRCAECGSRLTFALAKGRFAYFFCLGTQRNTRRCTQPYAPVDDVEAAVAGYYRRLRLPADMRDELRVEIEAAVANQRADGHQALASTRRRLTQFDHDRERLMRAYYAEAIAPERLRDEHQRLDLEQSQAHALLADVERRLLRIDRLVDTAMVLAAELHITYAQAEPPAQRMLNHAIFDTIEVRDARVVNASFRAPLHAILALR